MGKTEDTGKEEGKETSAKDASQKVKALEPNVDVLKDAVEALRKDLGKGLISIDFFSSEKPVSIAGYNSKPETLDLIKKLTEYLAVELENSGHAGLGKYYLLNVADGNLLVAILHSEYSCQILVDGTKTEVEHLIKDIVPVVMDSIDGALTM